MGILVLKVGCARSAPPVTPPSARVVGYAMGGDCVLPVAPDQRPCPDLAAPGRTLSVAQTISIAALMTDPDSWTTTAGDCFEPHQGFVWEDSRGEPIQQLSVSLGCGQVRAKPGLTSVPGQPTAASLSPSGLSGFRSLCHDVGLGRCEEARP